MPYYPPILGGGTVTAIDHLTDVDTTTDAPALSEVLKWDGSNWVPATYNYEFAFSIASFSDGISDTDQLIGTGNWQTIGGISFTATYNNAPGTMTAEVAMTGASTAWGSNLPMTPVTGPETNTEAVTYPSSTGGTVKFTLSVSAGTNTSTDQVTFNNTMRYGTSGSTIGNQIEAIIENLTEVAGPSESRSQTISNIAGTTTNYTVFAYADRLSDVSQVQLDSGFGYVTASFNSTATTLAPAIQTTGLTTVSNSAGFIEAFACTTSRLQGLANGTTDFKLLTSSTAQNYLYWGELNKAGTYTEANVEDNYATQPGKVASNTISSRSMIVNCGTNEYTYISYPSRIGTLTSILINGFESLPDFAIDGTIAITNDAGYTEDYRVYVSDNPGFTDPTTMTVTSSQKCHQSQEK